jgi:hypothetical protein
VQSNSNEEACQHAFGESEWNEAGMKFEAVRHIGITLPEVEERTVCGMPALITSELPTNRKLIGRVATGLPRTQIYC